MIRRASALVVAVLLAAAAIVVRAGAAAAASTTRLTTWQWNVAGWQMHRGSITDGMTAAAAASIVNRRADVVVFTELCLQQYNNIIARLRAAAWPNDSSNFARFQTGLAGTCNGQDFGQAIFTRRAPRGAIRTLLPDDPRTEDQYLLCVPLTGLAVRACGVHITTDARLLPDGTPANTAQLKAALRAVESYDAQGWTVLIGGDFNAQPDYGRIHPWYSPAAGNGGTGHYRELDDTDSRCRGYGTWTATGLPGASPMCSGGSTTCTASVATGCAKVDLEFVRENHIAGAYFGDVLAIPMSCPTIRGTPAYPAGSCSDHRVYVASATVSYG